MTINIATTGKPNPFTHKEAFVELVKIARAHPETAAAIDRIMDTLTAELVLARGFADIAQHHGRETNAQALRASLEQLEALDPTPDYDF